MPSIQEPSPGVFIVHLPLPMKPTIINVTLLHSAGEWALIDTGMHTEQSLGVLQEAMGEVGCSLSGLRQIIATHHHPDHFGASQAIRELTGARVLMHEQEYEASLHYKPTHRPEGVLAFFERHGLPMDRFANVPSPGEYWAKLYRPAQPDAFLCDGDVLRVGDFEIDVIATPGHTPGHCVLRLRGSDVMIAGDHLLPKITPHVGRYPDGPENPLGNFLESQRRIRDVSASLVLPAHGGTFSKHQHRVDQIIQHHEFRLKEMLDLIRRRPLTAYEVARISFGFDGDAPVTMQFPATFETLAHLEYLCHSGQAERDASDSRTRYLALSRN